MFRSWLISKNSKEVNAIPRSETNINRLRLKIEAKCLIVSFELVVCTGKSQMNLVKEFISIRICLKLLDDLASGPK